MFNLITLIIAVALTAALSLAEVTYVGSAFLTSSPKAVAAQVISAMSQVDSAWTLWGTSNTTTLLVPTMTNTGLATDLLGVAGQTATQFLASVPTAPSSAVIFGGVANSNKYQLDLQVGAGTDVVETGIYVVLDNTSLNLCTEIARAGGQVSPTGTLAVPGTGLTLTASNPATFTAAFTGYKLAQITI